MATKSTYHKTEKMGPFSGERFYTTNQDLKVSDIVYVISSKGTGEALKAFLEGQFRVENSVQGKFEIEGRVYEYESTLSDVVRPDSPISLSALRARKGKREFASRYLNVAKPNLEEEEIQEFNRLLSGIPSNLSRAATIEGSLSGDIQSILQADTEALATILARLGQGKFRKNVTKVWGAEKEMCALTGIALPAILTASHIVPWRDCVGEKAGLRLNGANGILLCSNIDRLFDRYLLSFSQTGGAARIRFSKILPSDLLVQLGLTSDLELVPNGMVQADKELFFECLSKHHATFLEKESER